MSLSLVWFGVDENHSCGVFFTVRHCWISDYRVENVVEKSSDYNTSSIPNVIPVGHGFVPGNGCVLRDISGMDHGNDSDVGVLNLLIL